MLYLANMTDVAPKNQLEELKEKMRADAKPLIDAYEKELERQLLIVDGIKRKLKTLRSLENL